MGFLGKLFGGGRVPEPTLCPANEMVDRAAIPFAFGGAVDLHDFPQPGRGTVMPTMDLFAPVESNLYSTGEHAPII